MSIKYCECGRLIRVPPSRMRRRRGKNKKWTAPLQDHGICWHCFLALLNACRRVVRAEDRDEHR